ncbi:MAG: ABC transporter permease [Mycoplasma sp.]|nr:ABC transporter permease [Mycoplasma sp.]
MKNFLSKFGSFLKKWYVVLVLLAIYVPLVLIILISFNGETSRGNIKLNFDVPTFVNYINLFQNDQFINALLNSLLLGVIVTPFSLLFGVLTCYGLWKSRKTTKNFVLNVSRFSIMSPEVITGISLVLLFSATWIPMGFSFGFFTVALSHISFCTPYVIITVYPRMMKMNNNLVLASYDMGYNKIKTFLKVTVPHLLPSIFTASVIVIAMSWDDFIITNMVNGSWQTLGVAIYMTRKGIKAWVVTFGAILMLVTIVVIFIVAGFKIKKNKKVRVNK